MDDGRMTDGQKKGWVQCTIIELHCTGYWEIKIKWSTDIHIYSQWMKQICILHRIYYLSMDDMTAEYHLKSPYLVSPSKYQHMNSPKEKWENWSSYLFIIYQNRVYPMKHTHECVLNYFIVLLSVVLDVHDIFINSLLWCSTGTLTVMWLVQCQWSNPEGYRKHLPFEKFLGSTVCRYWEIISKIQYT